MRCKQDMDIMFFLWSEREGKEKEDEEDRPGLHGP
jgi:hypothetical protein